MNHAAKFHKATGPAFATGEQWFGITGNVEVTIVGVSKYPNTTGDHTSDYEVEYEWKENGKTVRHFKDAWNFQVRYVHIADRNL